jgi:SAM-dependent methyltransferase
MRHRHEFDHWWIRGRRRVFVELLRAHLGDAQPLRVLQIGSGDGAFLPELSELADLVLHTDLDRRALKRSAVRGYEQGVIAAERALPFADGSFDLVCVVDTLHSAADEHGALREILRVLRPGGIVFASVPAYPWLLARREREAGARRRYTAAHVRHLFGRAGFKLERSTHANALLFPLIAGAKLALRLAEMLEIPLGAPSARRTRVPWPWPFNSILYGALSLELLVSTRFDLPFGHSIAAIARRPLGALHGQRALQVKRAVERRRAA